MVPILSLWLPILVAAVLVWLTAALVWMVLPHHKGEFQGLPDEEAVRRAMGSAVEPGRYTVPHAATPEERESADWQRKLAEGPVAFITVLPRGSRGMTRQFVQSFVYYVVIGVFVAYVAGRTLEPGADYLAVFRIAGTVAWLGYGWSVVSEGIWFGRPWSSVMKWLFDALLYALVTAGTFGWLWP